MNRALFLRRAGLATLGLLTGDAALEAFERLTHVRKSFPSAEVPADWWQDGGWPATNPPPPPETYFIEIVSGRQWLVPGGDGPWIRVP